MVHYADINQDDDDRWTLEPDVICSSLGLKSDKAAVPLVSMPTLTNSDSFKLESLRSEYRLGITMWSRQRSKLCELSYLRVAYNPY